MRRSLIPSLLASFTALTTSGCVEMADDVTEIADDSDDPELGESEQAIGTAIRPRPACGTSCWWQGETRNLFWDGHDSQPQIASDIGSGKVARDITYCLFKSAVGSNGQREVTAKRVGQGTWYEQGVSTRMALSSASAPYGNIQGAITGWHSVTLTSFGQKLNPDVQWFELRFPVELKTSRPSGVWSYDAQGRLVAQTYKPTGYYTDATSDYFTGSKPLSGMYPAPTLSLNVGQTVAHGGNNLLNPWPVFGDDSYPSWESGQTTMLFGQTLTSSTPSTELHARVPIVSAAVLTIDLFADAQVRHFLELRQGPDPDLGTRGEIKLTMGSKTTFKIRVQGKLKFGWFDVDINQVLFDWSPLSETKLLGLASFDRRAIYKHVDVNGANDSNPAGWLNSCLASTPSVSSEVPKSDPQQWVDGIRTTVIGNVVGCPTTPEFGIGKLCDKAGRPLPTYP